MTELFVVVGATGHVGAAVADGLLAAGRRVRVVGRDAAKLERFRGRGAELAVGSVEDPAFVKQTFQGASAAFLMIPPNFAATDFRGYQRAVTRNYVGALGSVKHVVTLSSVGADRQDGNGPVGGLYDLEQALDAVSGLNVLHLRPSFFMENLLGNLGMVKGMALNGSPAKPELAMPLIATRDIGAAALEELSTLSFTGRSVRDLLGPRDLTMTEVTRLLGAAIGRPDLPYVQFSYEDAVQGMIGMGLPEPFARGYAEMYKGMNDGWVKPTQPRSARTNTPTDFAYFASNVLAPAWEAMK